MSNVPRTPMSPRTSWTHDDKLDGSTTTHWANLKDWNDDHWSTAGKSKSHPVHKSFQNFDRSQATNGSEPAISPDIIGLLRPPTGWHAAAAVVFGMLYYPQEPLISAWSSYVLMCVALYAAVDIGIMLLSALCAAATWLPISERYWELSFHLYNALGLGPASTTVWALASWALLPIVIPLPPSYRYRDFEPPTSCVQASMECAALDHAACCNRICAALAAVSVLRLLLLVMVQQTSAMHLQTKYQAQVILLLLLLLTKHQAQVCDATFKRRAMDRLVEYAYLLSANQDLDQKPEEAETLCKRPLIHEGPQYMQLTKRNFWYHVGLLESHPFPLTSWLNEDQQLRSSTCGISVLSDHVQQHAASLYRDLEGITIQTFKDCMCSRDAEDAWQIYSGYRGHAYSSLTAEEFSKVSGALAVENTHLCVALFDSSYTTDFLRTLSLFISVIGFTLAVLWVSGTELLHELFMLSSSLLISGAFAFKKPIERWVDALLLVLVKQLCLLLVCQSQVIERCPQVKQPFDIGDYVVLDDTKGYEGYGLTVLQITIERTLFRDKIGNMVYISNADLYSMRGITNWNRSQTRKIILVYAVALETTAEQLKQLENFVRCYITDRKHTFLTSAEIFLFTPWMSECKNFLRWELRVVHRMRGPSISKGAGFRADRSSISFAISAHMRQLGIQPMTELVQFRCEPHRAPEPTQMRWEKEDELSAPAEHCSNAAKPALFCHPSVYHDPAKATAMAAEGACVDSIEPDSETSLSFGKFDLQNNGDDYATDMLAPASRKNKKTGNNGWLYQASPGVLSSIPTTPPRVVPNLFLPRQVRS